MAFDDMVNVFTCNIIKNNPHSANLALRYTENCLLQQLIKSRRKYFCWWSYYDLILYNIIL